MKLLCIRVCLAALVGAAVLLFAAVVPLHLRAELLLVAEQVAVDDLPQLSVRIKAQKDGVPYALNTGNVVVVEDNYAVLPVSVGAPDANGFQTVVWRSVVVVNPRVVVYDGANKASILCSIYGTGLLSADMLTIYDDTYSFIRDLSFGVVNVGQSRTKRLYVRALSGIASPDGSERLRIDSITMSSPDFSFVWKGGLLPSTTPPTSIVSPLYYGIDIIYKPSVAAYVRCVMTVHFEGKAQRKFMLIGNVFPIQTRSLIQLVSPNGGEVFSPCQEVEVRWRGANPLVESYIDYSIDDGKSWQLAGSVLDSVFLWRVPDIVCDSVRLRVRQNFARSEELLPVGDEQGMYATAFSADSRTVGGAYDNTVVRGWETESLNQTFRCQMRAVSEHLDTAVFVDNNGNSYQVLYRKDIVKSIGMGFGATGSVVACFRNMRPVVSANGAAYISTGEDTLAVFQPGTETPIALVPIEGLDTLRRFLVAPGGEFGIALPEMGRRISLFSTADGRHLRDVDFDRPVSAMTLSRDGARAIVAFATGQVGLYSLPAFVLEKEIDCSSVPMAIAVDASADGSLLALACRISSKDVERRCEVHVFDVASGQVVRTHRNATSEAMQMLLTATNTFLFGAFRGVSQLAVWNIPKYEYEGSFNGHTTVLSDMQESPNGHYIATTAPSRTDNLKLRSLSFPESDVSDGRMRVVPVRVAVQPVDIPIVLLGKTVDTLLAAALCNTGETPVIFDNVAIVSGTLFSLVNFPLGDTLFPGECLPVTLRLHALDTGAVADTLRATTCSRVFNVPLRVFVRDYAITMLRDTVDVGVACVGGVAEQDMCLLRNDDTVELLVDKVIVELSNGTFAVVPFVENVLLKPGDSLCVRLRFSPLQHGAVKALIRVLYAGQSRVRRTIVLQGSGGGAELASVSPYVCFLPELPVRSVRLVNRSSNAVVLTAAALSNTGYEVLTPLPVSIAAGDTVSVLVRWDTVQQSSVELVVRAEPCGIATPVVLLPYRGSSVLSVPDVEADPRGEAVVAVRFSNAAEHPYAGARPLTLGFAVRADMFLPRSFSSPYGEVSVLQHDVIGDMRFVTVRVEGDFADTGTALVMTGPAGLGSVVETPLVLTELSSWSESITTTRRDGVLRLLNTCGARRLLSADALAVRIAPSPASESASIHVDTEYVGVADVVVQDMAGRVVRRYSWAIGPEAFPHTLQVHDLVPGAYRVVVHESGRVGSAVLVIVR